jgi:hypothetical protein
MLSYDNMYHQQCLFRIVVASVGLQHTPSNFSPQAAAFRSNRSCHHTCMLDQFSIRLRVSSSSSSCIDHSPQVTRHPAYITATASINTNLQDDTDVETQNNNDTDHRRDKDAQ